MQRRYSTSTVHENSLKNLNRDGRSPNWSDTKERHNVSLTREGWGLLQAKAKRNGLSVSEYLEHLARGLDLDW